MKFLCRLCASEQGQYLYRANGYDLYQCDHCQSIQTLHVPLAEELAQHYSDNYYQGHKAGFSKAAYVDYIADRQYLQMNFKRRIHWLQQRIHPKNAEPRWLDIGCAAGFLLELVRDLRFSPYGLDYSDFGPAYAREVLHMPNARQGTLDQLPSDFPQAFDVISFFDVLEHVTDQRATLEAAIHLLRPGGHVVGETFDPRSQMARALGKKWHAIDPPNHLQILSLAGIEQLMQAHHLQSRGNLRPGRWLSMGSIVSKFGQVGSRAAALIHDSPVQKMGVPIWLNDIVLWVYQKPLA